jgi:hypothetical protein
MFARAKRRASRLGSLPVAEVGSLRRGCSMSCPTRPLSERTTLLPCCTQDGAWHQKIRFITFPARIRPASRAVKRSSRSAYMAEQRLLRRRGLPGPTSGAGCPHRGQGRRHQRPALEHTALPHHPNTGRLKVAICASQVLNTFDNRGWASLDGDDAEPAFRREHASRRFTKASATACT